MESDNESVVDFEESKNGSSSNLNSGDKLPVEILETIKSVALIEKVINNKFLLSLEFNYLLYHYSYGNEHNL